MAPSSREAELLRRWGGTTLCCCSRASAYGDDDLVSLPKFLSVDFLNSRQFRKTERQEAGMASDSNAQRRRMNATTSGSHELLEQGEL